MNGQRIVEACARRAARKQCEHLSSPSQIENSVNYHGRIIAREFARVGELVEAIVNAASTTTESGLCWCYSRYPDPLNGSPRTDDDHDDDCVRLRAALAALPGDERGDGER